MFTQKVKGTYYPSCVSAWIPIVYVSNGSITPAKFFHVWINMKIEDDCILRFLMMEFCEMYEFYNSNLLKKLLYNIASQKLVSAPCPI